MKLDEINTKTIVTIEKINNQGAFKRRMMELGLIPGKEIYIQKYAPMGNPMEIKLDGQSLSIRNEEASLIEVGDYHG
jgi:ferrous iron transport protein A